MISWGKGLGVWNTAPAFLEILNFVPVSGWGFSLILINFWVSMSQKPENGASRTTFSFVKSENAKKLKNLEVNPEPLNLMPTFQVYCAKRLAISKVSKKTQKTLRRKKKGSWV